MLTLDNLKITMSSNRDKCNCGTAYCSDIQNVFDNNQGLMTEFAISSTK